MAAAAAVAAAEIHLEAEVEHHSVEVEERQAQLVAAVVVLLLLVDSTDNRQHNSDIHRMQHMDPGPHNIGRNNRLGSLLPEHQVLKV